MAQDSAAAAPLSHRAPKIPSYLMLSVLAVLAFCLMPHLRAESTHEPPASSQTLIGDDIFEQINEGSGLANQIISAFAEDNDGFLWIGSQGGLQRWDGYRLWTYKTQLGVADSLPDNWTKVLHTDPNGNLWVGTSAGGLARYDRQHDRFVRYTGSVNSTAPVNIESIEDDGTGNLWVGSGTGLDYLDSVTQTFTHVHLSDTTGKRIDPGAVQALLRTSDGALWIGSTDGLFRCSPNLLSGASKSCLANRIFVGDRRQDRISVASLFAERNGTIWVGTDHGLYIADDSSARRSSVQKANGQSLPIALPEAEESIVAHRPSSSAPLPAALFTSHIHSIARDKNQDIWVGTQEQGIFIVNPATWGVRHIMHDPARPTSLSDDWIEDLFLSRQGIMLVASERGVSYVDTTTRGIVSRLGSEAPGASLRDSDAYSVLPRPDGSLWIGLSKRGIDILSPTGKRIAEIRTSNAHTAGQSIDSLPEGTVGDIRESGSGGVYIVTQQGLYFAEGTDLPAESLRSEVDKTPRLFHPRLKLLPIGPEASQGLYQVLPYRDEQGHERVWIGSATGLWTYDPSGSGPAVRPKFSKPLTDPRVRVLLRGSGNFLWIGTGNGLNRYDVITGEVVTILPNPVDPEGLGAGLVSTMMVDHKGRLWIGTFSGGIHLLQNIDSRGNATFRRILGGLPDGNVDCLLEAKDGKIWASTDGGLVVIDPFNFGMRVLSRAEGSSILTYWDGVGGKTTNGDLVFGGSGGITIVRPSLVKPWTYVPPVVVTSASIGSTELPISRFNSGTDQYPIWIPADNNNLTVEFASLDYTAPDRNRYEYKLQEFDRDWIPANPTRRVLRYTNLPPGRYTLLLRGSNRDGVWAPVRSVRILVLPTWYQKAWFRIVVFLAAMLLLFAIFLLATAYMRRQQRELERQVALRTAELEQKTVELKQSQQQLEHMAYTDSLTGLPNRRMFTEHFRRLLALKQRQQGSFALLLMDFDRFKVINDTYGHDAGDAVLKEMACRMSAVVRESDCLARLGGDEYGLILGQSPDPEATEMVCQKIIESFTEPILFGGTELRTSPSIGVALYPFDGMSQDTLYKNADLALYEAKHNGGNTYAWGPGSAPQIQLQ